MIKMENTTSNTDRIESEMHIIKDMNDKITTNCADIDAQIQLLMNKRDIITNPLNEIISKHSEVIKLEILELAKSYKCGVGEVRYRKGYDRNSWNNDKLEGFAVRCPEIMEFRKTTHVKPSVSVNIF